MKVILNKDAIDVNAKTTGGLATGMTPLHSAVDTGTIECVKVLLAQRGIDVNALASTVSDFSFTALQLAAKKGDTECVKVLLELRGIDVNVQNEKGLTALHIAVENGFTECVRELLSDKRINVDIATNKGETPLKLAEHSETVHKQEILSLLQLHRKIKQDQITFNSKAHSTSLFSSKYYLVVLFVFLLIVCVVVGLHK